MNSTIDIPCAEVVPSNRLSADEVSDKDFRRHLDPSFYEAMVKVGITIGMSPIEIGKAMKMKVADVLALRYKYQNDLNSLKEHRQVTTAILKDLIFVKFTKLTLELFDELQNSDLRPKEKLELFKFMVNFLAEQEERKAAADGANKRDQITPEEAKKRLERLNQELAIANA